MDGETKAEETDILWMGGFPLSLGVYEDGTSTA